MQVESLNAKLVALNDKIFNRLRSVQTREAGVTADVLLSLLERMKSEVSPLPRRYSDFQAFAYNVHGIIAWDEGTKESARRAVTHFENQLEVNESIGFADGIATAKANIAAAKSKFKGGRNNEELLKASQGFYELRVAEYGEEHESTIWAGNAYAIHLLNFKRWGEARELLINLLATSKQVLGPNHSTTYEVKRGLERAKHFGG